MQTRYFVVLVMLVFVPEAICWAQVGAAKPPAPVTKEPEEAVRQAVLAYVDALNAGNFKAVAAFWTADGDYCDPTGRIFKARKVIEEEWSKRFGGSERPKMTIDIKSIRMITPDVAVEDGETEITRADSKSIARARYTTVWVKQQGKWLISNLRELMPSRASHRQRLADLEWLVGHFTANAEGATVQVMSEWSPTKSFILREISIERPDQPVHNITQRIGWDPLTQRLKSWIFDADGGVSEGYWTKQGDSWMLRTEGVNHHGHPTSSKNLYTNITDSGFVLESLEAHVKGEPQPDFKVRFQRQAGLE